MSRYRNPIFAVPTFQSSVRDNDRIKELIFPIIHEHRKSGITEPPNGWFTDKLITSFKDDEFNNKLISDDDIGTEIKNQYFDVLKTFFNTSFECTIKDIWYNCYKNQEYQESHITPSQHIPLDTLDEHLESLQNYDTLYFFCRSGNRSGQACNLLTPYLNAQLYNIEGGLLEWESQNLPTNDQTTEL